MNHLMLAKFKPEYSKDQILEMFEDVKAIYNEATAIPGIHNVEYHVNCIDRPNRYDISVNLIMDKDALPLWDESETHKKWLNGYGHMLETKCIFDYED